MRVFILGKPHIMGFELDIYVSEARKAIEFDGSYWHSDQGLKRNRSHWPQEDIDNYHILKDTYFKLKGIEILHINEEEWTNNPQVAVEKCFKFLKTV